MHTSYWKTGVAAVLTGLILGAGASAQEGASGDVTIKNEKPAVTAPTDSSANEAKMVKPAIVERDPFINQLQSNRIVDNHQPHRNPVPIKPGDKTVKPQARPDADPVATNTEVPEEIPAPEVTVNGILLSSSGSQAIISTQHGMRMVSAGQKLGDYKVSAIGQNYVSFSYGSDRVFKVPMASEF